MNQETINRIVELANTGKQADLPEDRFHIGLIQKGAVVSAEEFSKKPYSISEARTLPSLKSFTDYVTGFGGKNTVIFADNERNVLEAVLDYHGKEDPSWCRHKVTFKLEQDEDFKNFLSLDRRPMNQTQLVMELSDYAQEFVQPSPADILDLVRNIKAAKTDDFSGKVTPGQVNQKSERTITVTGGNGVEIPEMFKIALPVFSGVSTKYEIPFRMLWKHVEDSREKLLFEIRTVRKHLIVKQAFDDVCKDVKKAVPMEVRLFGANVG